MRRYRSILRTIITSVLTFVVLGFLFVVYIGTRVQNPALPKGESTQPAKQKVPAPQQIAAQLTGPISAPIADVATRSIQPVVGIAVLKPDGDSLFKTASKEEWGLGSGIIVDPNGYILTNNHVAGVKSKRIIVSLAGGENVDGRTLWSDPIMDLAVVKIDVTGLPTAKLGDSNALRVGEPAIAIGNPLGLEFQRTVTAGIISALNRTIEIDTEQGTNFMEDLIQTDASINPGNSGGPLMNSKGEVIGLNTVKVTSAEGIGFAIPINVVKPIINSFINKGTFNDPYLGVFAYDRQVMPFVDPSIDVDGGVYVAKIDRSGPAAKSGIKIGDVIRKVDQTVVQTMAGLRTEINTRNPGDVVKLTVVSNGSEKVVSVTLGRKTKDGLVTR